jgi:hypothetical protein
VPGGIRTPNLLIRSQKLYPVELQAPDEMGRTTAENRAGNICSGVANGTRTRNSQNHNLGLYH